MNALSINIPANFIASCESTLNMRAGAMTSAAAAGRNTTTNTQRLPSMREAGGQMPFPT